MRPHLRSHALGSTARDLLSTIQRVRADPESLLEELAVGARRHRGSIAKRRLQRAVRDAWTSRSNFGSSRLQLGRIEKGTPIESALLGLRLGTAHLSGTAQVRPGSSGRSLVTTGSVFEVTVNQVPLRSIRLEWTGTLTTDGPTQVHGFTPFAGRNFTKSDVEFGSDAHHAVVSGLTVQRQNDTFSPQPTYGGTCERVTLGTESTSKRWNVVLVGLSMATEASVDVILKGVKVRIRRPHGEVRPRSGMPNVVADLGIGAITVGSVASALRLQPDRVDQTLPSLCDIELTFADPVGPADVDEFLESHLTWLLEPYSGRRVIPLTVTQVDVKERVEAGHFVDYGRDVMQPLRRTVTTWTRLEQYLHDVAATWEAMTPDQRQIMRIAIGARHGSANADLETSINVAALALELLVAEWLPSQGATYGLSKTQKASIAQALVAETNRVAPGTSYANAVNRVAGTLFQRTAADKLGRLLGALRVPMSEVDLNHFIKIRNAMTHGRITKQTTDDKIKAMLAGQHALTTSVLSQLGFTGSMYSELHHGEFKFE